MSSLHTGRCQCGAATYEFGADPIVVYACHCSICQRQSGSAFAMAAVFDRAAFAISGVKLLHFVRQGHGRKFRCYFCPECGSRIYHQWFNADGEFPYINLKPGTLDDRSWLIPGCHVWTSSAQPWMRFSPVDVVFETQPEIAEMPRFAKVPEPV